MSEPGTSWQRQAERGGGPTVLRMIVGTQLRRPREQANMSREEAADRIRGSEAKMSRLELGRTGFKQRDIVDLLTAYGVTDDVERAAMVDLAGRANKPGWWQSFNDVMPGWLENYVGLEQAASVLRTYEPLFVPGLLQTEAYAAAVLGLGNLTQADEIKERVTLRMRRQQLLDARLAPSYWVVLDEAVLRRTIGDAAVMAEQLDHLLTMMARPGIIVQVVPFSRAGRVASGGSFTLLRFEQSDLPDVVYLEQLTSALYVDKREDVSTYLEVIDTLGAVAYTPSQSTEFITRLRDEM